MRHHSIALLTIAARLVSAFTPVYGQAPAQPPATPLANALRLSVAGANDSALLVLEAIVAKRLPATPRALQEIVGIYARTNRLDAAARALERARRGGTDLSGIAGRTDVAPLRGDARFAALFPAPNAFDAPFVEPTRIIHEWRGERPGDEFGWIARGIGDVDGDRITDIVVSATMNAPYGSTNGRIYVYSGKSGRRLWTREGAPGSLLGLSVESAGDVDRDGVPDVIAGAPGNRTALVLSGRDGREVCRLQGDSTAGNFGGAVSGAGDVDGDGYADVLVGASGAAGRLTRSGRAFVFSGRTGARLLALDGERENDAFGSTVAGESGLLAIGAPGAGPTQGGRVYLFTAPNATPRFIEDADATGSALGATFVAIAGDVDGDGTLDVYASDYTNRAKGTATGRVYVYSGATGKVVLTLTGDAAGETFGTSASRAGDVDGDGRADLAVGSWQYGGAAWSGGRVTVFSSRDGRVLQRLTGRVAGETLGFDAVGIGDVDGDGAVDFLVTSAYSLVNGVRSGRVYVVAGQTHRQ
jgi:hypothetical protein